MPSHADQSGDFVLESETNLQVDGSTLAGLGPRSLASTLDLLLIIVPVSDDPAAFAPFIASVEARVEPPFSVLIVYDRENDSTLPVATEFSKARPWLDLIPNTAGPGETNALRAGFQAAGHGPAVVMSIDGSDDPRELSRMRRLYAEGHPIVAGSRDLRGGRRRGGTRLSRACGRFTNRLVRRIGRLSLTDATHSFRLYDASLVNELGIDTDWKEDVPLELAMKAAARDLPIIEIPTTWTDAAPVRQRMARLLRLPALLRLCRALRRQGGPPRSVNAPSTAPSP